MRYSGTPHGFCTFRAYEKLTIKVSLCYAHAHDLPAGRQGLDKGMPKKTKKEKQLARQHRHSLISVGAVQSSASHIPPLSQTHYTLSSLPAMSSVTVSPAVKSTEYQFLKKDLIKTVLLTVAILTSELLLTRLIS